MFKLFSGKKKNEEVSLENLVENNSNFLDILSPDSIEENDNYMRLGSNYVRTLAVAHFSNEVYIGFLDKLHNLGANVSVVHHIEPMSSDAMIKALDKAVTEYKSQLHDARIKTSEQRTIENNIKDATILLENLTSSDSEIFNEHMFVHVQASSLQELNRVTQSVQNAVNKSLKLFAPTYRMRDAFESCLPLNQNKLKELTYRNFDAEALSSLFPFDESELLHDKGIIKGRNMKTKNLVMVDHDALINRHEYVCGPSGSGKSTYLWGDMMRRWGQGVKIRVIDPKGEFGKKFKRLDGEWVKISPTNDKVINPFEITSTTILRDEAGNPIESSLLHRKISNLKTMFTLMYHNLKENQVSMSLLEKAIIKTYNDKGINWDTDFSNFTSKDYPVMQDLYETIAELMKQDEFKQLNDLYQVLYQYVEGSYSKAMNGPTNVDLSKDLIAFDLWDLKDDAELQKVAMYNILTFLEEDAVRDMDVVQVYVDEAHILADRRNPLAMKFLANMYKLIRSFNGGVTSATQQVRDFLSATDGQRNYGEAVILNSVSKLYLPMSQKEFDIIVDQTSQSFSEEEERILVMKNADRNESAGKGVYTVGSTKISLQVELHPAELQLWDYERFETEYRHVRNNDDILIPTRRSEVVEEKPIELVKVK
ncbi:VirB4 family type IV secretion system protein [Priestia endophytica]|uniref:AAA-like domain-containing protein n=1 Tax=Priestia endophytica DSM 13796 TaxID=1121089 RepID=A0A1I6BZY5_9BACI|nr:DUF87 domain-containing protein [Priestia endophytica]SFQ86500.1 AAA-like domain-containing protein [Priestia endophytica DSM 13796]